MSEELKPCPFYNHDMPILQRVLDGRDRLLGVRWVVICGTCGCAGPNERTSEEAAKCWNTRAYEVREEAHEKMQEAISKYIKYRKGAISIRKAIEACLKSIDIEELKLEHPRNRKRG